MIELPETFRILHGIPYEPIDAVRSDACKAYGDQRAAEAREQMRKECMKLFPHPHAEYFGREAVDAIKELK